MSLFDRIRLWLQVLSRAEPLQQDMDEEMRLHLERASERLAARGMSLQQARIVARREFGNIDLIQDEARVARRGRSSMERFITSLRHGVRRLVHEWRFSAAVVMVLAVGIGPTAAISSVFYGILVKPLAYREPDRLGLVRINLGMIQNHPGLCEGEVLDLRRSGLFDRVESENRLDEVTLGTTPDLVPLTRLGMTTGMLSMLGVQPLLGRGFLDEDLPTPNVPGRDAPGPRPAPPPVRVLLDYDTWKTRFGGESSVIGRLIQLNGGPAEVIGVLPSGFRLVTGRAAPQRVDVYYPARMTEYRNFWGHPTLVRLKPGMSFTEVETRLAALARTMKAEHPEAYQNELRLTVAPLLDDMTRAAQPAFRAAAGAVLLLLVIAFANATALIVARLKTREIDVVVRSALGAGSGALVREVVLESVLLAMAGAFVGALVGMAATVGIRRIIPRTVPRWDQIGLGWEQLLYAAAFAFVGLVLLAIIPAWKISRGPDFRILRSGSVQGGKAEGALSRLVLVGSQMAFTVVLAFGCVQLARSAAGLRRVDLGFDPNVLTLQIPYDFRQYRSDTARALLYQHIRDRVRQVPGVTSVGVATHLPLSGSTMIDGYTKDLSKEPTFEQSANYQGVTPGYFKTLRIAFVEGRDFTDEEDAGTRPVIIVDESLARTLFPGQRNVIGQTLRLGWGLANAQIVGVVRHARSIEVSREVRPQIYAPIGNLFQQTGIVTVRASGDAKLLSNAVVSAINEVGPGRAVSKVAMLTDNVAAATSTLRAVTGLITLLALSAGLLSAAGLYLVMAYIIHQHRRATAIRSALGATPRRVMRDLFRTSVLVACFALPVGALLSLAIAPFFNGLVFRVADRDALSLLGAIAIAATAGLLGTYFPVRRAARVNILHTLREM